MKMRTGRLLLASTLLAACTAGPEGGEDRTRQRNAALAQAGAEAELLAVCGPFQAAEGADPAITLPAAGKFVAIVRKANDDLLIHEPFVIPANPPVSPDGMIVAVDEQGRVLPQAARASNTILRERTRTPWSSSFVAALWRADAQGAPIFEDREEYRATKSLFSHKMAAEVTVNGRTSRFTAACD